ncbi:KATNB1-like protein 1 [Cynoglossus semilaevis]|uniref:KATNB1-like protein 1 n=1 Tax=Cynoglossus semilaevis TaxID=244447 RepID=A0A3P8UEN5_CYNSE|nr:KATNB1-like protein 1 [Cynoglossus semilaevis]XP_016893982.1 KATNB1-like protein 1 [Cynoglossus semilaevis]
MMDSNSEDEDYENTEQTSHHESAKYKVMYPRDRKQKGCSTSRSGNTPGRVKRVVSCKRKTHHLTMARRKQPGSVRMHGVAKKDDETSRVQNTQQETFCMDPLEFPPYVSHNDRAGRTGPEHADYSTITELTKDHRTMTDVLFGRHLRLRVALTLWQRNVGELLTYFLRTQDTGVLVDFLPLISQSIGKEPSRMTIGCCVDLFPFVRKVLNNPYEEYLTAGLNWINAVLMHWRKELIASGYSGSSPHIEKNFQVFNQQLLEFWQEEHLFKSAPGVVGDMAKAIDSFLSELA